MMSKKRQRKQPAEIFVPTGHPTAAVTTLVWDYTPFFSVPEHFHDEAQLVYATRGVMTLRAGAETWTVPPHKAVWIPARTAHAIQMSKAVSMRTLYVAPRLARRLPRSCVVLHVSALLRELVLHCCAQRRLDSADPYQNALIKIVLRQIAEAQTMALSLPLPHDPRAAKLAERILAEPSEQRPLAALCRLAGASKRTLERIFLAETGLGLGKWRQKARLLHGIRLVAEGAKITEAALEAGYNSPSAFISMFRRTLGTTPSQYFATT